MNQGISVIIPAVDEALSIGKAVDQFLQHANRNLIEVIVVDGGSKDATKEIAAGAGATVEVCSKRNRAAQMNVGAAKAAYDILYFVHADVLVPASFLHDISTAMFNGFQSGCYRSAFDKYPGLMRLNSFMTRFNLLTFRGGDQTLFITKSAFQKIHGFDEYYSIMEDYDIISRIWQTKIPFQLIQKDVIISTRKYNNNSWLRVQIANGVAMSLFKLGKSPEDIKKYYRKLLRYKHENYLPSS